MTKWEQHAKNFGGRCQLCGGLAREACRDGICRGCHVNISWEDCTSGVWAARELKKNRQVVYGAGVSKCGADRR